MRRQAAMHAVQALAPVELNPSHRGPIRPAGRPTNPQLLPNISAPPLPPLPVEWEDIRIVGAKRPVGGRAGAV